jgi:hypothetical protein
MHLTRAAQALRAVHVAIAGVELASLGYLWLCACTSRRDNLLRAAIAVVLVGEGVALLVGNGDCPLGPLQKRLGDPAPLLELILPRSAAKAAVPIFASATLVGTATVAAQSVASRRSTRCRQEQRVRSSTRACRRVNGRRTDRADGLVP